jgi:hypothetical protein
MTKLKFPNVVEADLIMRMEYESAFGIYDHQAPDNPEVPWPLLFVSPKESLANVDPLDFRLDQFAENRVHEIFGISFDQLIQFPRRDFLKVIASAKKHSAKALGGTSGKLRDLEKMLESQTKGKPPG